MGRLVGLELHNFKSYKGRCSVGFGDAKFTSIIGPNGAGKSNMMDAISFVLGVPSLHLRSATLKDLIYRGHVGLQDPTMAYVTAIYEQDDGEQIHFTRSVSNASVSEYKINHKSVTANQYMATLKRENILIKARNFLVFQGDVEQIASQNPKDLTRLIETISGSGELADRYSELKDAKDQAHEFTNAVFARKRVLNSELKQYKDQMEEQHQFEIKLTEKSDLIKLSYLYKLYHNQQQHQKLCSKINEESLKVAELKVELKSEETGLKSLTSELAKTELSLKKMKKLLNLSEESLISHNQKLLPLEQRKVALSTKINTGKKKLKEIEIEISTQKEKVKKLERQHSDARKMYLEFQTNSNKSTGEIDEDGQKEYESLRAQFLTSGGAELEESLDRLTSEYDSYATAIKNLDDHIQKSEQKVIDLDEIIANELQGKLHEVSDEINDSLEQKITLEKKREDLINSQQELKYKELDLNKKLRDVLVKIDDLSSEQRETQRQKKLRETVNLLRKLSPPNLIKGLVTELVRPTQLQYSSALLCLLGAHSNLIVVETAQVAYKCIQILKERRTGVATFIPLDTISAPALNLGYLRQLHPQSKPGLDIVEYDDPSLDIAIQYVIGDALVADSMDVARELKWGEHVLDKRIVTVEGSLIHKSGLMTGGTREGIQTTNWDKTEWKRLNDQKEDYLLLLSALNDEKPNHVEIKNLEEEISTWESKLPMLRTQKQNIERLIQDRQRELDFYQNAIEKLREEQDKKTESMDNLKPEMGSINIDVKKLQEKIYLQFCQKYHFADGISEYEEMHGSAYIRKSKERSQYSKAISTLSSKLDFENEKLNASQSRYLKLQEQIQELENTLVQILEEYETLQNDIDQVEAEIEITKSEIEQVELTHKSKKKVVSEAETAVDDLNKEVQEFSNQVTSLEEMSLSTDIERANILKNCKIEGILIPIKGLVLENVTLSDNLNELVKDIYGFEIDYELVPNKYKISFSAKTMAEIDAQISQLNEDLDKLAPNAKAKERLKDAEKKLKEFDRDLAKAKLKEKNCVDKFNEVKENRFRLFSEAFSHISGEIDTVFKELTKLDVSPLGGSAYLTLEDEEEPYLAGIKYHAMPPTKRFRDMDLLSGGEKTIAALALLFAIHLFQPSPFFVLDEVDAALDNANVERIANYIKEHASSNFQFIVISLKSSLFQNLDSLVGIFRDQRENSSKTVTLDLRKYEDEVVI